MHLPNNTLLQNGKYRIVRYINSGGFGCTYEAYHTVFEERVAIKEFFVKDFCNRDETTAHVTVGTLSKKGLVDKIRRKFIDEAKAIYRLNHPGIVRVSDVFEENGTAYYVMDFIDGHTLDELVNNSPMSEERALNYIRQAAEALDYIHSKNRLHLDIKPGNIMVNKDDKVIIIDFGASKQYDEESGENTSTLLGKTIGYAPIEQMNNSVQHFSSATDIYSLSATLYKLLTGKRPLNPVLRVDGEELDPLPDSVSESTKTALMNGMAIPRSKRPQSIKEFISLFDAKKSEKPKPENDETLILSEDKTELEDDIEVTVIDASTAFTKKTKKYTVNGVSFNMVSVPGGSFAMGTDARFVNQETCRESPMHMVTLNTFMLGETPVTQMLWEAVMGKNPSAFKGGDRPVELVSWDDCMEFIYRLNQLTGVHFRLPTEAEWEYAAAGGENKYQKLIYSGSNDINDVAWCADTLGHQKETRPVATKSPNQLGIYDMSGNVWEWCADWFGNYTYASQVNPKGPLYGTDHVIRGGCWANSANACRIANRSYDHPSSRLPILGFRLAHSI